MCDNIATFIHGNVLVSCPNNYYDILCSCTSHMIIQLILAVIVVGIIVKLLGGDPR